jgi:hypothetical protein
LVSENTEQHQLDAGVTAEVTETVEQVVAPSGEVVQVIETSTTEFFVDDSEEPYQAIETTITTTIDDGAVVEVQREVEQTSFDDEGEVESQTTTQVTESVEEGYVVETVENVTSLEVESDDSTGETTTTLEVTETTTDNTTGELEQVIEHTAVTVEDEDGEVIEASHNNVEQNYDDEGEVEQVSNTDLEYFAEPEEETATLITETTTQNIEDGQVDSVEIHAISVDYSEGLPESIEQEFVVENVDDDGSVDHVDTHTVEETLEEGQVVEVVHQYQSADISDGVVTSIETYNVVETVSEGSIVDSQPFETPADAPSEGSSLGEVVENVASISQQIQQIQCERDAAAAANAVQDVFHGGFDAAQEPSEVDAVISDYLSGYIAQVFPEYAADEEEPVLVQSGHCSQ